MELLEPAPEYGDLWLLKTLWAIGRGRDWNEVLSDGAKYFECPFQSVATSRVHTQFSFGDNYLNLAVSTTASSLTCRWFNGSEQ